MTEKEDFRIEERWSQLTHASNDLGITIPRLTFHNEYILSKRISSKR